MTEPDTLEPQQGDRGEIGVARPDELDSILRVMCTAFELPYEIARPIFYADPYLKADNKRVVRVDGRVVSCLTITELKCRIGSGLVDVAGIAGVATLPEHRRKGYASRLLASTIPILSARGLALASLFPYQPDYYRKLGWEIVGSLCCYVAQPTSLPAYVEADDVQTLDSSDVEPIESIANLYARSLGRRCLSVVRDRERWGALWTRVKTRQIFRVDGNVEGYLFSEVCPGTIRVGSTEAATPPTLRILEMVASSPRAQRALIGSLARQSQIGRIEYQAHWEGLREAGLLDVPWTARSKTNSVTTTGFHIENVSGIMLRIVDFFTVLQSLLPNWNHWEDRTCAEGVKPTALQVIELRVVELRLQDDVDTHSAQSVLVSERADGLPGVMLQRLTGNLKSTSLLAENMLTVNRSMEDAEGRMIDPSYPNNVDSNVVELAGTGRVEGNVRVWAQVVVGCLSGEEACSLGLLHASTPDASTWLKRLFPARSPSLPTLDL